MKRWISLWVWVIFAWLCQLPLATQSYAQVAPTITDFTPSSAVVDTQIIISGTNFSSTPGNNYVAFTAPTGQTASTVATASSPIALTVKVPLHAITGRVSVTVSNQSATSSTNFTVPAPTITRFILSNGPTGFQIEITGSNFSSIPSSDVVGFTKIAAGYVYATATAASSTSLTAPLPSNAITGPIVVTVGNQSVTSSGNFTVPAVVTSVTATPAVITGTSPTSVTVQLAPAMANLPVSALCTVKAASVDIQPSNTLMTNALGQAIFSLTGSNLIIIDPNTNNMPSASCIFRVGSTFSNAVSFITGNVCTFALLPAPAQCGNPP